MVNKYIPERGDVVWLDFDPVQGHEQNGRRPAFVLSSVEYNKKSNLTIFCPITSVSKKYPFEVLIKTKKIEGVVLSDQIKNFDRSKRNIKFICKTDNETIQDIVEKVSILIN